MEGLSLSMCVFHLQIMNAFQLLLVFTANFGSHLCNMMSALIETFVILPRFFKNEKI